MSDRTAATRASGFTLTEIMVVVIVIGVLAGIAVPMYGKARTEARVRQAQAAVQILSAGILQLANDTGDWPNGESRTSTHDQELWNLRTGAAGLIATDGRFSNWQGPYVPSVDRDPWGSDYFFDPDYTSGGRVRVAVGSFGPNRRGRNVYDSDNIVILLDR